MRLLSVFLILIVSAVFSAHAESAEEYDELYPDIRFEPEFYDEADDRMDNEKGSFSGAGEELYERESDPDEILFEALTPAPFTTPEPKQPSRKKAAVSLADDEAALARVVMGKDLTTAQKKAVYEAFGIEPGSVEEIEVSNEEEHALLSGVVSDDKIGRSALNCVYVRMLSKGSGIDIKLQNVTFISERTIRNAMRTAGIDNVSVTVYAPYPVSGSGAITGIYKAFESLTGKKLSAAAKRAGAEELGVTGELSGEIGNEEAEQLIGELKAVLDETSEMSDSQLKKLIRKTAEKSGKELSGKQVSRVVKLVRRLEDLDDAELADEINGSEKKNNGLISTVLNMFGELFD